MDPSLSLFPVVWSQRSMNFLKIQVIRHKSKPTRVAMIWLRVKVNRTRLSTADHFARNEIKYRKSRESGLVQYILYGCTIAYLSFIQLYNQKFYTCYSLSPSYIEIGELPDACNLEAPSLSSTLTASCADFRSSAMLLICLRLAGILNAVKFDLDYLFQAFARHH